MTELLQSHTICYHKFLKGTFALYLVVFEGIQCQLMSMDGVDTESTQQLKYLYLYQGIVGVQHCREGGDREERGVYREGTSVEDCVQNSVCTLQVCLRHELLVQ